MSSHLPPSKRSKKKIGSQQQLDKLEKKNLLEQQRRIKPGECHKYIRVLIDPEFITRTAGSKITAVLTDMNFKYEIKNQKTPRTILWERSEQQFLMPDNNDKVLLSDKCVLEKHIIFLMFPEELIEAIKMKTLENIIGEIKSNFEDVTVTLLIYGLKKFYKTNDSSHIKRDQLEKSLTELQILHNCSHRLQETADEIAQTVGQFSKSIAEIPFKKQKAEKFEDICLFLENDNKDCVRVDGNAGLSRLWQQHLTRLPHVTLETAEAILYKFPTPKSLLEVYDRDDVDAPQILENLKIRRGGHPLTSVRRIGPELSRKIHTLYTSLNPDEKL